MRKENRKSISLLGYRSGDWVFGSSHEVEEREGSHEETQICQFTHASCPRVFWKSFYTGPEWLPCKLLELQVLGSTESGRRLGEIYFYNTTII